MSSLQDYKRHIQSVYNQTKHSIYQLEVRIKENSFEDQEHYGGRVDRFLGYQIDQLVDSQENLIDTLKRIKLGQVPRDEIEDWQKQAKEYAKSCAKHKKLQEQQLQYTSSKRYGGVCKKFILKRGFGFISMDDNQGDIFVHCTEIHSSSHRILMVGESVEFNVVKQDNGKRKATNVTAPGGGHVRICYVK
eukprot:25655_1